ncbi:MAG TPA: sialidase family protein [Acidimicrobiales bacterium]|nr:sialidase family protein [Acidimicrobiales bacterium]
MDTDRTSGAMGAGPLADRRTGLLVAAAVAGVVLVIVGLVVARSNGDSTPGLRVLAGDNHPVTGVAAGGLESFGSPAVVASASDPDTLVVAARVERPQLSAVVRRSSDAGATWATAELPAPPGERAYSPDLAMAGGRVYAAYVTLAEATNNPSGVWLAQSTDGGASFAPPAKVAGPYGYQPRVLVHGDMVHVSFVQASSSLEGVRNGFGPPPNPVVVATSTDGGARFGQAVPVSGQRQRVGAATPFVDAGGDLMVLFEDFGDDVTDFEAKPGPDYTGSYSLVLARSTDGGTTFQETSVVDDAVRPMGRFSPYSPVFPSVAVAPSGAASGPSAIYVAWADGAGSDWDVHLRRSDDGASTWGQRVRVNTDQTKTAQYLPAVAVAPSGRVDVAFLDRSEDPKGNMLTGAALATSFDAGATWRSVVVSDHLFDAMIGPEGFTAGMADPGSRLSLTSDKDRAVVAWTDARQGTEATARQDVYVAPVTIGAA